MVDGSARLDRVVPVDTPRTPVRPARPLRRAGRLAVAPGLPCGLAEELARVRHAGHHDAHAELDAGPDHGFACVVYWQILISRPTRDVGYKVYCSTHTCNVFRCRKRHQAPDAYCRYNRQEYANAEHGEDANLLVPWVVKLVQLCEWQHEHP